MFRLEEESYLFILLLLPILFFTYNYAKQYRQKIFSKLGEREILEPELSPQIKYFKWKSILFLLGFLFCILALINPQFGKQTEKVQSSNVDIFIALDVSTSMLAEDIQPNRLQRAQLWIKQFTERFPSERIGLISFAGNAYLQSPLTTDIATIQLISTTLTPQSIGTQGTSLAAAINQAYDVMQDQNGNHKVLILITDGEDHEEEVMTAVKKAANKGISIITVPIGKEEGAYIPVSTAAGRSFKIDKDGKYILSKPNRTLLREIAIEGKGEMIEITNGDEVFDSLKKRFALISKKATTMQSFSNYASYFQYFLFFGICFFIVDLLIVRKK